MSTLRGISIIASVQIHRRSSVLGKTIHGPQIWTLDEDKYSLDVILRIYRVTVKKVSFCIFRIILVSKGKNYSTIETKDEGLSLSKFS